MRSAPLSTLLLGCLLVSAVSADQPGHGRSKEQIAAIEAQFAYVKVVQARHERDLFRIPGVHAVGIGVDDAASTDVDTEKVLYVLHSGDKTPPQIPPSLDGVRVVPVQAPPFYFYDSCASTGSCAHRNRFDFPVPSGVSTGNGAYCGSGTIAFKVCDLSDPNLVGYLTSEHVATAGAPAGCPDMSHAGTVQFQPGGAELSCQAGLAIGTLERELPLIDGTNADAAFVRSDHLRLSGEILDLGFPTTTPRTPLVGETVIKSGRTTGLTQGRVVMTNVTVSAGSWSLECPSVILTGMLVVNPIGGGSFALPGDSGAPVVDPANNPVGLVSGGNPLGSIFVTPIVNALARLNLTCDCNGAEFVSQSVPTSMNPGQSYDVSVTFKNPGTTTWTINSYRLRSQNPLGNTRWGIDHVNLTGTVEPGVTIQFNFTVTAPSTQGQYPFQWAMFQDGIGVFGSSTPSILVNVGPPPARMPIIRVPHHIRSPRTASATVELDSVAPTGGLTVSLKSSNPAVASVPAGVFVPGNSTTSQPFTVTTTVVPASTSVTLTATYLSSSSATDVIVDPPIYEGYFDGADCRTLWGWAWNPDFPNTPINVDLYDGATALGTVAANLFRQDLLNASKGNGYHAFVWNVPLTMLNGASHPINVRFGGTATALAWSPRTISCPAVAVTGISGQGNIALGQAITNTVTVSGGRAPYSYRFVYFDGAVWTEGQAYGPSNTWTWTPSHTGSYSMQVWVKNAGSTAAWDAYSGYSFNVTAPVDDAVVVTTSGIPSNMITGQTVAVSVTMRNTGTTTWVAATGYKLGDASPTPGQFGPTRVPVGANVPPGGQATFSFTLTAPTTPGTYTFGWRMLQEMVRWFGAYAPAGGYSITVTAPPPPPVSRLAWMAPGNTPGYTMWDPTSTDLILAGTVTNVPTGTSVTVLYISWSDMIWRSGTTTTINNTTGAWFFVIPNAILSNNYSAYVVASGIVPQSNQCWSGPNANRVTICP